MKRLYVSMYGRTGEALATRIRLKWQRTRSIRLSERNLVKGKRFMCTHKQAAEKGSKQNDIPAKTEMAFSHSKSYKDSKVGSGEISQSEQPDSTYLKRLYTLWRSSEQNPNFQAFGLWKLISNRELWLAAYKKLAPNPGSMTKKSAGGTIDGTSFKSLKALKQSVSNGNFQFGTTRRVYIPKPNGSHRPLGIPVFQDRLVQEVIKPLLEALFEPCFSERSHGFRPGRSQHTCLKQIRRDFKAVIWYIEG